MIAPPTTETPIVAPTIPPSLDYSLASEAESNPSEDLASGHIPPLPVISSFLSSDDDTTNSDTSDTPPSPTHDTPFTENTASTQRSHVIPCRRVMILSPGQPISHGRPYRYHPKGRQSASDHSSPDLPSTSAGPSRKRRRSPMKSVPALPLVSEALSPVCADLIPPPKRVGDIGYLADVEVDPRETIVEKAILVHRIQTTRGVQREQGHRIIGVKSAVTALTERVAELERDNQRLRGTASVESQRVDRIQRGMSRMQRKMRQMRRFRFYDRVRVGRLEALKNWLPAKSARNLKTLNENEEEQEGKNGGNENEGNGGNGSGDMEEMRMEEMEKMGIMA
nr:hypothetical protein [Tanacetum cinerariifolium]